ncbi:MAG TPA: hypothetical protein VIT20_00100 [Propionibacteriaceae bacterium]
MMSSDPEALFQGRIYRVTGEPVVANLESSVGAERELHLARCRTLRKYKPGSTALVPLTDAEVDEAWIRAVDEGTTTETSATEWPFSSETGWCPICIVKVLTIDSGGKYKHPHARSARWRPGVPLACRFPTAHGLGHCGCAVDPPPAASS